MDPEYCAWCRSGRLVDPKSAGGLQACRKCYLDGTAYFVPTPEVDDTIYRQRLADYPPSARQSLQTDAQGFVTVDGSGFAERKS